MSSSNRKSSCCTYLKLSLAFYNSLNISTPFIFVMPESYFTKPVINFIIVLFPLPLLSLMDYNLLIAWFCCQEKSKHQLYQMGFMRICFLIAFPQEYKMIYLILSNFFHSILSCLFVLFRCIIYIRCLLNLILHHLILLDLYFIFLIFQWNLQDSCFLIRNIFCFL